MRVKEEVKKLWKLCFNDSDEFIEMYFRLRYNNDTSMVIQSGDMVISALQMIPYPLNFQGTELLSSYISGACTHPDFRGKGVMAQLLAESFSRMIQRNIPLSILIPADTGLFDYYARMGYASAFFSSQIKQRASDITTNKGTLHFEHITNFDRAVFDYFTAKANHRVNCLVHTETDFRIILEDLKISEGCVTVAYKGKGGPIGGMIFAYPDEGFLNVSETLADNTSIQDNLIRESAHYHQQDQIIRYTPPTHGKGEKPFGMARIIQARTILPIFAATYPQERINIQLTDDLLSFNNGFYYIDKGNCTYSKEKQTNEHMELTIQELSAWIFDRSRLYMSLMLE